MKLEEKLLSLRKAKGLSQMKLAEMMQVSRQAISRWETGTAVPSIENLKYLSNLYDVSLDDLLHDGTDKLERNQGIADQLEGAPLSVPNPVDDGKNERRRSAVWAAVVLGLLVLAAAIYIIGAMDGNEEDFVPIDQMERRKVTTETGPGFDFGW